VCAFVGSHVDLGTQLHQRLTKIKRKMVLKKEKETRGATDSQAKLFAAPFLRFHPE
jgi:hypothetical protein